jgi:hypothetical protein
VFLALGTGNVFAERRIALVIGNSNYKNPDLSLLNPKNDAEDMAAVLKDLESLIGRFLNQVSQVFMPRVFECRTTS